VDKVPAVLTEAIPSIFRVVENFGEAGALRLARHRPDDGLSAVLVIAPGHAALSEAIVKRLKQIPPPRRAQLTSGSAAAGAEARRLGRFSRCRRIRAANGAIGSGLPPARSSPSLMYLSDEGG
jgi:hypothetical protein